MSNTNSTIITNLIASPPVKNDISAVGGKMRVIHDSFQVTSGDFDAVGDTLALCRLSAEARISRIRIGNDDLSTGTSYAFNVGIYPKGERTAANAKDENVFAAGVTQFTGLQGLIDVFKPVDPADIGKRLWELAGDASASAGVYDLVLTVSVNAGTPATGNVGFQVWYAID